MPKTITSSTLISSWSRGPKWGRSIVMRRFHARGRGRASRIEKWFSHLKIVVAEREAAPEDWKEGGLMGHKVNPIGLRLGINRTWDSRWFAGADYSKLLHDDLQLRTHLRKKLSGAGVSRVVIERPAKKPRVTIYAARPGVVIGKKGQDIEVLRKDPLPRWPRPRSP